MLGTVGNAIGDTTRVVRAMATGDLKPRIETQYEGDFGQLANGVNESADKMSDILGKIIMSSEQIRANAEEIASGNSDLSARTEQQASSLEETSSNMENMTGLVRTTAANAQSASNLAGSVQKQADEGGQVVHDAVAAMESINEASKKIADIISVIDEIAFQTNLLALNAAVEAARAGEQGRGFAVVAGEVRSLAQRSAEAAREIKDLIRDSSARVASGTELVSASGQTLSQLVASISEVTQQINEISAAAQAQASGIEQVNAAVVQMDQMTQQNASLVQEAMAASQNMAHQSRSMVEAASYFDLGDHRAAAPAPVSRPQATPKTASAPVPAPQPLAPGDDDWSEF